jgi:cbb3-type cytochrome oxidase subunit 3
MPQWTIFFLFFFLTQISFSFKQAKKHLILNDGSLKGLNILVYSG